MTEELYPYSTTDKTAYNRNKQSERSLRISEIPHGTYLGYQSWMCRCRRCLVAYQAWKAERLAALPPERHGTTTAYNYGCRCVKCSTAKIQYERAHPSKRKDRS